MSRKILKFKSFLRKKLNQYMQTYYEGCKITYLFLFENAANDHRLSTFAQAYYLSIGNIRLANKFSKFTKRTYNSLDEYLQSDDKYSTEYVWYLKKAFEFKQFYRHEIIRLKADKAISYYAISKKLNIPQINLSNFLNKNIDGALSIENIVKIHEYLESH